MAIILKNIFKLSTQLPKQNIFRCCQSVGLISTKKNLTNDEDDTDRPVTFSTSKAATWKAEYSFSGTSQDDVSPSYQPLVVCLSVAVFLIYFGYLREENDVDQKLGMSLYDRIDGLEEAQLKAAIAYYKENDKNYDVSPMEKRLLEIETKKKTK